jgi:2'-5' RNA ligase
MMSLYLLAILPPETIDTQASKWKTFMLDHYGCRVAMKSPAHITLIPPFHLADERVDSLTELLEKFARRFSAFELELNNFAAFAPRVIYVHVNHAATLEALKKELEDELLAKDYPIKKEERSFHPHITIANRDLKKQDFPKAWQYFKDLQYNERFAASAISLLKHNGQRWITLFHAALP